MKINNISFKHSSERKFGEYLDSLGINYIYQPEVIHLDKKVKWHLKYKADFYLPDDNKYIEVIGSRQAFYSNIKKILEIKKLGVEIDLLKPNGDKFVSRKYNINVLPKKNRVKNVVRKKKREFVSKKNGVKLLASYLVRNNIHDFSIIEKYSDGSTKEIKIEDFAKFLYD